MSIENSDRLIFAVDVPEVEQAKDLVTQLGPSVNFFKIGMELMMTGDYFELLDWLVERDKKVFVDLKFKAISTLISAANFFVNKKWIRFVSANGCGLVTMATISSTRTVFSF